MSSSLFSLLPAAVPTIAAMASGTGTTLVTASAGEAAPPWWAIRPTLASSARRELSSDAAARVASALAPPRSGEPAPSRAGRRIGPPPCPPWSRHQPECAVVGHGDGDHQGSSAGEAAPPWPPRESGRLLGTRRWQGEAH